MNERKTPVLPGTKWRILAHDESGSVELADRGVFDELAIDDWIHLEQMDTNLWWMRVGDVRIMIVVESTGRARVDIQRGAYGTVNGDTSNWSDPRAEKPE